MTDSKIRINDVIPVKIEWLSMNLTLRDTAFDCNNVTTLKELEEVLSAQSYFNVPISNFTDVIIQKAMDFTVHHLTNPLDPLDQKLSEWDLTFVNKVIADHGVSAIYELLSLGDYLQNDQLLTVCAIYIAQHEINGRSIQELRKKYGIQNDFTVEEEQQIAEQTKWVNEYSDNNFKK